jgi:hypothetical protein
MFLAKTIVLGSLVCNGFITNIFGEPRMPMKLPVQLTLHESFPKEQIDTLKDAMGVWNKASGKKLFILKDDVTKNEQGRDGLNVIYWITKWDKEEQYEGLTLNYFLMTPITESDVMINAKYITTDHVDFKTLLIHELGHVLGLDHSEDNDSVMLPTLPSYVQRHTLGWGDKSNLKCLGR